MTSASRFKITYCAACGFKLRAEALAVELQERLSEKSELIQADGGIFDVEDRATVIFSKNQTGRFPEDGEILGIIKHVGKGMNLDEAQLKASQECARNKKYVTWTANFSKE